MGGGHLISNDTLIDGSSLRKDLTATPLTNTWGGELLASGTIASTDVAVASWPLGTGAARSST